jgi:hypothetical protein
VRRAEVDWNSKGILRHRRSPLSNIDVIILIAVYRRCAEIDAVGIRHLLIDAIGLRVTGENGNKKSENLQ